MELIIYQKPENGILGGPKRKTFSISLNNSFYEISIQQNVQREIRIISSSSDYHNLLTVYYTLETLLMLLDGQFYPTIYVYDGADVTQAWKRRSLVSYSSADYMIGAWNKLLDFECVIDEGLLLSWYSLKNELDIIHNMVLQCLSNVGTTVDIKCAFMVEAFQGISELIHKKYPEFVVPKAKPNDSQLKLCFLSVVHRNGEEIFGKELTANNEAFAQILVDSRNRIAHIKSKQNRKYLSGEECVVYLKKLSLLYRIVLFDLLGIPKEMYYDKLLSQIKFMDEQPTLIHFIHNLG